MPPCWRSLHSLSPGSTRLITTNARLKTRLQPQRRHFLQAASQGFLDIALALPLPPSLPPYSTAIILATIASRVVILPAYIWSRNRRLRMDEQVFPAIEKAKPFLAQTVLAEMKKDGVRGEVEYLKAEHGKRMKESLISMQKELLKKFKCGPRPTIIIPIITQIPVFVAMSMLCARIAAPPTPLDGESFLTLSTLAHTDPTMVLPVVVGMLTLANVEASSWFLTAEQLAKQKEQERKIVEKAREKGKPPIVVEKVVKGAMRGLSVVRILITSVMPGSVVIYWLTSSVIGLVQTVVFNILDQRRKLLLSASVAEVVVPQAAAPVSPPVSKVAPAPLAAPPTKSRKAKAARR